MLRVGFGTALLCALIWYVDPKQVAHALMGLSLAWIGISALLIICTALIGAINSYLLINLEKNLAFTTFLPLFWLSWAVGMVFPGQVGDMATMATQLRRRGIDLSVSIGRSLADKLISLILMVAFAAWEISNLPPFSIPAVWTAGLFLLFVLGAWQVKRFFAWLSAAKGRIASFVSKAIFETYQVIVHHPQRITGNAILTVIKICLTGVSYWCVFNALGYYGIDPWRVITLVAISSLVAYIPISFNGIGTAEITGVVLFSAIGLNEADTLSAYLVLRVMVMTIAWFPTGLWLLVGPPRRD